LCRPGAHEYRLADAGPYTAWMELIRILIFCLLAAILASLGLAFYHLATSKGDSSKMLRALTVRIVLSIALFLLLMLAWRAGYITPRGLER
jgi:hypothetical protein